MVNLNIFLIDAGWRLMMDNKIIVEKEKKFLYGEDPQTMKSANSKRCIAESFPDDLIDRLSATDVDELKQPLKIAVRKSPIHGYGVFATEDIFENEIIEEAHYQLTHIRKGLLCSKCMPAYFNLSRYCYIEPCDCKACHSTGHQFVLAGGCFMQYNSCKESQDQNMSIQWNKIANRITSVAKKNIKKDQELMCYHGKHYYNSWVGDEGSDIRGNNLLRDIR